MKLDTAIKVVRELQRYRDPECKKRDPKGWYIRNVLKPCTNAQFSEALNATDVTKLRYARVVWADLATLKSAKQSCLSPRRLIYQLRRVPHKKRPTVCRLKDGTHLVWDGNHRAVAHVLLGRRRIRCVEIRKA